MAHKISDSYDFSDIVDSFDDDHCKFNYILEVDSWIYVLL